MKNEKNYSVHYVSRHNKYAELSDVSAPNELNFIFEFDRIEARRISRRIIFRYLVIFYFLGYLI